ncbi:MAG: aminopeptidase [Deltaproteobacteria bacterium]|nr:MAG: aminopeptidase [Deltaproteobacteria bacterium]
MDERTAKLAQILVRHSLRVKRGEVVRVSGNDLAKPLVLACYREVLRAGGHPLLDVSFDEAGEIFYREARDFQVDFLAPSKLYEAKKIDCAIFIHSPLNTRMLTSVDPRKISRRRKATKPVSDAIMKRVRWVLVNFPTPALAQEAEMSLGEYEDFLFGACLVDWKKMERRLRRIKRVMEKTKVVRIVGRETDLTFSIEGRKAIICAGECNMPDGEIFTAPVEGSVEGEIYYEFPAIYGGREVSGIRLVFRKGRVVEAKAEKNEGLLKALIDTDRGARIPGEFGIGYNDGITRYTRDILFDEKIGGTIHIALGKSYAESGGKNDSALHWDMVKDLRKEGEIYFDGKLVFQKGKFVWDEKGD